MMVLMEWVWRLQSRKVMSDSMNAMDTPTWSGGTSSDVGTVANPRGWALAGVLPWPYSLSREPVKSPRRHQSKAAANCDREMCVWLGPEVARCSKACRIGALSGAHLGRAWRQVLGVRQGMGVVSLSSVM